MSEKSGIPECIFVHANGFIGGNNTYEGVLAMAKVSLKQQTWEWWCPSFIKYKSGGRFSKRCPHWYKGWYKYMYLNCG